MYIGTVFLFIQFILLKFLFLNCYNKTMVENFLMNFSEVHRILTYVAIFLGMFIEGELILIFAGILVRSGTIDFLDSVFIALAG